MNETDIQTFIRTIPRNIEENLKFRENLNLLCQTNEDFKKTFLWLCKNSNQIFFDVLMWAFNPLEIAERRILPFILRPKQIIAFNTIEWCIDNQHDAGIEKSRKQGATEAVKLFVKKCLFEKNVNFIVGSLKKEDVDNRPDPTTIFAKIDNAVEMLPEWMGVGEDLVERKDMIIHFKQTNSSIVGETTNENFSAGSRATAVFPDEFGRLPKNIAEMIEGAVHDVSRCIIYNSTHWLGINHPFNLAINRETTKKVTLFWWENPEEMEGAYTSPQKDIVELIDENYYRQRWPELFNYVN